jgi:RNA polymerase sigma-70 factor (ECF subfamily)
VAGHERDVTSPGPTLEDRFRQFYAANFDALLAYALRRADHPEDAADVVAESFHVAWRRIREVPAADEARLWLYGVARNVLANHRRGGRRRERLGERLRTHLAERIAPDHAERVSAGHDVREALSRMGDLDREVLVLSAWEGLEPREIAVVVGASAAAVRTRLTRARSRLRELLGDRVGDVTVLSGHVSGVRPILTSEEGR